MTTKFNALQNNAARMDLGLRGAAFEQLVNGLLTQSGPISTPQWRDLTAQVTTLGSLVREVYLGQGKWSGLVGLSLDFINKVVAINKDIDERGLSEVKIAELLGAAGTFLDLFSELSKAGSVTPLGVTAYAGFKTLSLASSAVALSVPDATLGSAFGIGIPDAIPKIGFAIIGVRIYDIGSGDRVTVVETLDPDTGIRRFAQTSTVGTNTTLVERLLNGQFLLVDANNPNVKTPLAVNPLSKENLKLNYGDPISGTARFRMMSWDGFDGGGSGIALSELEILDNLPASYEQFESQLISAASNSGVPIASQIYVLEGSLAGINLTGASAILAPDGLVTVLLVNGDRYQANASGQLSSLTYSSDFESSTATLRAFNGTQIVSIQNRDGSSEELRLDASGQTQSRLRTVQVNGEEVVSLYTAQNQLLSQRIHSFDGESDFYKLLDGQGKLIAFERFEPYIDNTGEAATRSVFYDATTGEMITGQLAFSDGETNVVNSDTQILTLQDNLRLSNLVSGLGDLNGAYQQWRAGNKVQGVVQLGSGAVNIVQALGSTEVAQSLAGTNAMLGGINQIINLHNVYGSGGNEFGKLSATSSAVNFANNNINRFLENGAAQNSVFNAQLSGFLNGNGQGLSSATSLGDVGVLPVLNLVNGIRNKDPFATISGIIGLVNPALLTTGPFGWILAGMSILFNATKEPPLGWGEGKFTFTPDPLNPGRLTVSVTGESFGVTQVRNTLEGFASTNNGVTRYNPGLRDYLYTMVNQTAPGAQQNAVTQSANRQNDFTAAVQLNPNAQAGIIAQRLPTLNFMEARGSDGPGFKITEIDPLTGQQVRGHLRWDDNWAAYNATVGNNAEQVSLMPALVRAAIARGAIARGAIAPMWEVRTAEQQQQANDPLAGLTEEERSARLGFLAKTNAQGKPIAVTFRPIVLDLNLDGQISRVANADSSAAFDWDDRSDASGYCNNHYLWISRFIRKKGLRNSGGIYAKVC